MIGLSPIGRGERPNSTSGSGSRVRYSDGKILGGLNPRKATSNRKGYRPKFVWSIPIKRLLLASLIPAVPMGSSYTALNVGPSTGLARAQKPPRYIPSYALSRALKLISFNTAHDETLIRSAQ